MFNLGHSFDDLSYLSPTSKARRLGYLNLLAIFLMQNNGKYGLRKLSKDFAIFASGYQAAFLDYNYSSGEIISSSQSAKPYIKLSLEIDLASKDIANYYLNETSFQLTKNNPFYLSPTLKDYFWRKFYAKDKWFMWHILKFLQCNWKDAAFQIFKLRLREYPWTSSHADKKNLSIGPYLAKVMSNDYYFESAILSRLHWLADLGFIKVEEGSYDPFIVSLQFSEDSNNILLYLPQD